MIKVSQKIVFSAFLGLSFTMVLFLSSCLKAPSLEEFLKDDDVNDKVISTRVDLNSASDSGLIAGNRRITNLNPNRYYMIKTEVKEERGDSDNPEIIPVSAGFGFIGSNGNVIPSEQANSLQKIGKVEGGVIVDLFNARTDAVNITPVTYTTYTVISASALTGHIYYYENLNSINDIQEKTPKLRFPANGIITAPKEGKYHYLDIGSFIKKDYRYEHCAPDPDPEDDKIINAERTGNIIQLSRAYNSVDYIFAEYDKDNNITNFRIITVHLLGETQEDGTMYIFEISYSTNMDNPLSITSDASEYIQSGAKSVINFEVEDAAEYDGFEWYVDIEDPSVPVSTSSTYAMNFEASLNYQVEGTYIIYVYAKQISSNRVFGTVIEITVRA